jgi:hypothetical protein
MKSTRQPTGEIVRAIIRRIVIAGLPHPRPRIVIRTPAEIQVY